MFIARSVAPSQRDDCNNDRTIQRPFRKTWHNGGTGGKLVFHIFGALAEFERNLIRERTKAGLEAARARGKKGGRRKKLSQQQRALAVGLYWQKKHPVEEICRTLGISKPTLYAYVEDEGPSSAK
jgi:DNA invertase Pin-like site-specific DNA recombinase